MTNRDFFDSEVTRKAYLGKHCYDLLSLSSEQAAVVYENRGLKIPLEVSSTLQYLDRQGPMSVADIAKYLKMPHQLATQRVEKLSKAGLVRKKPDPSDKRRFALHLTKKGREQARILEQCMADIAKVYEKMFHEIGCDLSEMLPAATSALRSVPIADRLAKKSK